MNTANARRNFWIGAALLAAAAIAAYLPALEAGFIWDDNDYVSHNMEIRTLGGLANIWLDPTSIPQYYPLVHTTYWIEYRLFGLDPSGYHLVNILIHAVNSVLLFVILRRLAVPVPLLAAAIFALHPVHVESVAWITERKNTLSALFYFLSLLAWLRWRPLESGAEGETEAEGGSIRWFWLSLAAFCCALLSKTVTCSLPAVILLLIWWKRARIRWKDVTATIPFFAIGLFMAWVTAFLEKEHVLAKGSAWDLSFVDRCLIAGRALWFYARKLVLPVDLSFNYPRWEIDSSLWWQSLFPATVVIAGAALWLLRGRIGRGPLVAILIFAGSLLPALGFIDVYPMLFSFVADHFQYLASVSLIVLVCAIAMSLVSFLAKRLAKDRVRQAGAVCAAILVLLLGSLTWQQCRIYESLEVLWYDTIEKNPRSSLALGNLGGMRVEQRRFDEALPLLVRALEAREDNPIAHNNIALVYLDKVVRGDREGEKSPEKTRFVEKARYHLERSISLREAYPYSHNNYGLLLWKLNDLAGAEKHFRRAFEIEPTLISAVRNLAAVCLEQRKEEDAAAFFESTLALDPRDTRSRLLLAGLYVKQERVDEAWEQHLIHLRLQPGDRAVVGSLARFVAAIPPSGQAAGPALAAEQICRSLPKQLPVILDALAATLAGQGRFAEAAEAERRALKLAENAGRKEDVARFWRKLAEYEKQR